MKKKIKVNGKYEYDLFIGKLDNITSYNLWYNNSKSWMPHIRNTSAIVLQDTGNGLEFTQREKGKLDYDELECLRIILKHIKD